MESVETEQRGARKNGVGVVGGHRRASYLRKKFEPYSPFKNLLSPSIFSSKARTLRDFASL